MFNHEVWSKQVDLIEAKSDHTITLSDITLCFSGENIDFLGYGAESYVYRVSVPSAEGENQSFAYKEYRSDGDAVDALKSWIWLKHAGIQIPSTFKLVQKNGRYVGILMTDLTNGWQDILITSNETKAYVIDNVMARNPLNVKRFVDFDLEDPEYIADMDGKLRDIASRASLAGIKFARGDILSAIFKSNGTLEPIISDMGGINMTNLSENSLNYFDNNYEMVRSINLFISDAHRIARETIT